MKPSLMPRLVLSLLAAATLSACGSAIGDVGPRPGEALTPTAQFPLKVKGAPDEIRLAVHAGGGLSPAQRDALEDIASRWMDHGGGPILVRAPLKNADSAATYAASMAAVTFLLSAGVPSERVERVGYDPGAEAPAPLIVGFEAFDPVIQACGRQWKNLTSTKDNKPGSNFGCAVSSNMAAQIANPADIAAPRAVDSADAARRSTVLQKYRQGGAGAQDSQGSGAAAGGSGSSGGSS